MKKLLKKFLTLNTTQLAWLLIICYISIPICGWLFFLFWLKIGAVNGSEFFVLSFLEQLSLINREKLNFIVFLPPYLLWLFILIISYQLFKIGQSTAKAFAVLSGLLFFLSLPLASTIFYGTGTLAFYFIMLIYFALLK